MTAAIVGIGQTEFSKDSGRSELQLAAEAVVAALTDAGLRPDQVDGMVTFTLDSSEELAVARSVGIPELRWTARTPGGGGGASATVLRGALGAAAGALLATATGGLLAAPGLGATAFGVAFGVDGFCAVLRGGCGFLAVAEPGGVKVRR